MNRSRIRLTCLLAALVMLSGCTAPSAAPQSTPLPTLPPAGNPYAAPIGDAGLQAEQLSALYLPSTDGQQLLTVYTPLTLACGQHPAEACVRALLRHEGNSRVRALGGGVRLALSGTDPVEVAGGVCTVNLAPSALDMSRQELFVVSQALTATLCELEGIRHVNLLVGGCAVAMDEAGWLPPGTQTATASRDLPALWDQLLARGTPADEKPAATPLTAAVTLYFPLSDGTGILPETRRIAFTGQHPQQLAIGLLDALSTGAESLDAAADMPNLSTLLTALPEVTELSDGSLRVTLRFRADVRSWITASGADPACCFAALVNTLTTFIPRLTQVRIFAGTTLLTSLRNDTQGGMFFEEGLHTRAAYSGFLRECATVYAAAGDFLTAVRVTFPYRSSRSPRALLLALSSLTGDAAVLPPGLSDADILGLSIADDTLLVNLSARYADVIRQSGMDQRLMVYAIVNTLCDGLQVRRIRITFGSESINTLNGSVLWSGEFLRNPGLIR